MLVGQCGIASRKTGLAVNTKFTTAESWNDFTVGTPGGWGMLIGAGGGGHSTGDGQPGASGAAVKVWMPAGKYRVWIGKGGIPNTARNTDNSGYGAHGGAGGAGNDGTAGGQGGTPTILLRWVVNAWVVFAVAGAGGGGGAHLNSFSGRPGGGGAWFSHLVNVNAQYVLFTYNGISMARGTLGGGWNSQNQDMSFLGGQNTTNTYLGGKGNNTTGVNADIQNQWAGGAGGGSTTNNRSGGGGGGGFGGGCGGNEGSTTGTVYAGHGGYIMVDSKRWGAAATGGGHTNACASGGSGGGSFWPEDGKSGEIPGSTIGMVSTTDWRCQVQLSKWYGLPVTTGQGGTSGNYVSTTAGFNGGFVYTGSTVPF